LSLRPFRNEFLVLALIGLSTFAVVQFPNTQDKTRLALTQSILEHADVTIERYGRPIDRARHGRHLYTDKAPGVSLVAVPAVLAVRGAERVSGRPRSMAVWGSTSRLHVVRTLVLAPFLLLLAWLVGRVSEGLAPGTGAAAAVAVSLATMLGALSTVLFAHVPETCLGFAAFIVLATGRENWRPVVAGALAGGAVLMDYEAALMVVALGLYVLVDRGGRPTLAYVAGGVPAAITLGVYNTLAFGLPLRLSYQFKDGPNAEAHGEGLFGIGRPQLDSLATTLVGERGFLTISPVVAAAAIGIGLLWRRGARRESALAFGIAILYVLLEAGYFLPYGGASPGPRFLAPAIPFLMLGLSIAMRARPLIVSALLALSVGLSTWNMFTWFDVGGEWPQTVWSVGPLPSSFGIALVAATAAVATATAAWQAVRASRPNRSVHAERSKLGWLR
jgi:hypothetical protein